MSSQLAAAVAEAVDVVNVRGQEVIELKAQLLARRTIRAELELLVIDLRALVAALRTQRAQSTAAG